MNITHKKNKTGSSIVIDGELTIYNVTNAKQTLFEGYENFASPIALDLKNVTEMDTAGVQLLLFAKKIFDEQQKNIYINKTNEHVDSVLHILDVAQHFTLEK